MNNGLQEPQSIVLLGGTSDIGLAIVRRLLSPATRRVVLAMRTPDQAAAVAALGNPAGVEIDVVAFDGGDVSSHPAVLDQIAAGGDIDVVIVAFAVLGSDDNLSDGNAAAAVATVNFTGAMSAMIAAGNVMRRQGHGTLVLLSSVAGERVRSGNPVYGATKAGIDGFAQGYGDAIAADGVRVVVVRPGFVHSKMTTGMSPAPLSTTPDAVAATTVKALRGGQRIVWSPAPLRVLMSVLRHLPGPLWRRMPQG